MKSYRTNLRDAPRVGGLAEARGWGNMQVQFLSHQTAAGAGKKPLGWKLAFGGSAALERLHINVPLVGFLMADAVVPSGSAISFAGWKKPAAEPELAVHMGRDLASGDDRQATMGAIAGLG